MEEGKDRWSLERFSEEEEGRFMFRCKSIYCEFFFLFVYGLVLGIVVDVSREIG